MHIVSLIHDHLIILIGPLKDYIMTVIVRITGYDDIHQGFPFSIDREKNVKYYCTFGISVANGWFFHSGIASEALTTGMD